MANITASAGWLMDIMLLTTNVPTQAVTSAMAGATKGGGLFAPTTATPSASKQAKAPRATTSKITL